MSIIDTKKLLKNLKENPLGGDTLAKEIGISKQKTLQNALQKDLKMVLYS